MLSWRGRTIIKLAAIILGACSQSASSGSSTTGSSGVSQQAPKGPSMSVADDEAVIANYYERDGWDKPDRIAPYDRVPGMYSIGNSNDLLVRSGKIVEGGGLDAASAYMRDVKLIERKPDVREFTTLLAIFKALPPTAPPDGARPEQYYDAPNFSKLNPEVQWSTDGGKFVLHYLLPFPGGGGGIVNPHIVRLFRWTLMISKDYKLAWRDEETTFNTTTQEIGGP